MKRLLIFILISFVWFNYAAAQNDDIEVTDSTSTDWGDDNGGNLNPQTPSGPVTSMTISQTSVTLEGGQCVRLVATVNANAANKAVTWTSSNNEIATVDAKGNVLGLKKGNTTITATAVGNSSVKKTCTVKVTSDYEGPALPNVPFEFLYDAINYDESTHSIPNHPRAQLASASLQLSENIPTLNNSICLRITDRCEGYLNCWDKGSTESGSYFHRYGTDCMTIVAKVAPKLNTGNACDFISNRGYDYNYMWRIGDNNSSFLHTGYAYSNERSLPYSSEVPQILAVRVDGKNDCIILQNLTTGESKQIDGVHWGDGEHFIFKLFYNDSGEFYTGDFYWVYYSFELLTDSELALLSGEHKVLKGDVNGDNMIDTQDAILVIQYYLGANPTNFNASNADVNGDGNIDTQDAILIIQDYLNNN